MPDVKLNEVRTPEWMESALGCSRSGALHYHLLHLKIDEEIFQPNAAPPDTGVKQEAKQASRSEAEEFVASFAENPQSVTGRAGETVFRAEEMLGYLNEDKQGTAQCKMGTFLVALRKSFECMGNPNKVLCYGRHNIPVEKKTGLWIKKLPYGSSIPLLKQVKDQYDRQVKSRINQSRGLKSSRIAAKIREGQN
jgi:hypothetical protein